MTITNQDNAQDTTTTSETNASLGTSDATNTRTNAIKAVTDGMAAQAAKEAERVAKQKAAYDEKLSRASLDDIEDLGLGETKGLDYNKIIKGLDPDAQKLVSNLRADYQRKTQAAAEATKAAKQIEADRKAMLDAGVYDKLNKDSEHNGEFDPFDVDSVQAYIKSKIAAGIKETLEPMHKQSQLNQRKAQIDSFKDEHTDWADHKPEMFALMQADPELKLEKAYWMAKGQNADKSARKQETELAASKDAARTAGLKVGGGNRGSATGIPEAIKAKGAVAIYEYLESQKATKK